MKNECSIVRDLLPLYAESMVSAETASFVKEHLEGCETCMAEYGKLKAPQPPREGADAAPLLRLRKKLAAKRMQTAALTAVLLITLLVSAFAVLDAPVYFPYSEELITAEPVGDCGLRFRFSEEITDFDYVIYPDPDGGSFYYCEIQAWTSQWDRWFSKGGGELSTVVLPKEPWPITALYVPNDASESVCIYGDMGDEGSIVMPRLSPVYYLLMAAAALAAAAVIWLLTRKKERLRIWVERIGLYPLAYIVSHCIVLGGSPVSYSLQRDFALIIFISVLLYSALLLTHSIWRLRREIKEAGR